MFKEFAGGVLVLGLGIAAMAGIGFAAFKSYEFYSPKYEEVRNKTFKESTAYNDGMIRDLEKLQMDYEQADEAGKASLKPIILHRFAVYDRERLPANLSAFYNSIRNDKAY